MPRSPSLPSAKSPPASPKSLSSSLLAHHGVIPVLALNRIVPRPALEAAEVGVIAVRAAEHEVAAAPGVH